MILVCFVLYCFPESCNDQGVCDLVKCQHGGQCLVQKDENPTCLCPLGFSGPLCETPLDLQVCYVCLECLSFFIVLTFIELKNKLCVGISL